MRNKGAKRLKDILKNVIKKQKLGKKLDDVEVLNQLNLILGKNLQAYIINSYFKNGTIFLHLNSSVLRSELKYQKEGIIESINKKMGKKIVKDVQLK